MKNWELLLIGLAVGVPIGIVLISLLVKTGARASYDNHEEWEFVRDKSTGKIAGVKVMRAARTG